ncbi:MAG: hypothetical protein KatS3mg028_1265 [Bacteroidia bacterium]|nr:MAG: hypothetical protein KatS3mg028_1265 [Bacteroidia bacterium]
MRSQRDVLSDQFLFLSFFQRFLYPAQHIFSFELFKVIPMLFCNNVFRSSNTTGLTCVSMCVEHCMMSNKFLNDVFAFVVYFFYDQFVFLQVLFEQFSHQIFFALRNVDRWFFWKFSFHGHSSSILTALMPFLNTSILKLFSISFSMTDIFWLQNYGNYFCFESFLVIILNF